MKIITITLIILALSLTWLRLAWCPHFDHSWPLVFMAISHFYVATCFVLMFWPLIRFRLRVLYFALWFVPGVIEGWAFIHLRLP